MRALVKAKESKKAGVNVALLSQNSPKTPPIYASLM
jgi:hypothetical protein